MILYKYYSYEAGLKAIETGKLGFRRPEKFNDPLEFSALSNVYGDECATRDHELITKKIIESSVVLCLTRSPLNPLMWAHYAGESAGIVIGYDFSKSEMMDCFCSFEHNLIPAVDGDVVYFGQKPRLQLTNNHNALINEIGEWFDKLIESPSEVKNLNLRSPNAYILMKNIMLAKYSAWSYEEEVRVVKFLPSDCSEHPSDDRLVDYFEIAKSDKGESVDGLFLYVNRIEKKGTHLAAAIESVYFGCRRKIIGGNPSEVDQQRDEKIESLIKVASGKGIRLWQIEASADSWGFTKKQLNFKYKKQRRLKNTN